MLKTVLQRLILTCSQAQGTSVYLDQQPENASTGIPQTVPAVPGHPGSHEHLVAPTSQGTVGMRCPPGSLISQCAGTGEGNQSMPGGNRRWVVGSGSAVDWAGTVGTPPGVHPIVVPGWRRRGTGRQWSRCWPHPRTGLWQHHPHQLEPLLVSLLLLFFLHQKCLILQHLLLWGWGPVNSYRAADLPNSVMCI